MARINEPIKVSPEQFKYLKRCAFYDQMFFSEARLEVKVAFRRALVFVETFLIYGHTI